MPNQVDAKIDEVTQAHVAESEAANISRNVEETAKRVKDAIAEFSALEVLASGYWEGLYYEAKIMALRNAVLEMANPQPLIVDAAAFDGVDLKMEVGGLINNPGALTLSGVGDPDPAMVEYVKNLPQGDDAVRVPAPKKARKPKAAA